mmetsp:Transcript_25702/g.25514  ORF Transcript_25702/g.25514 Transcript_25702/m.25514 type:complete len:237 (-) Transcript_25702:49-759(-)
MNKVIVLVSAVLCLACANSVFYDGNFFDKSANNFIAEGQFGPFMRTKEKIEAFTKLANNFIPALEDLNTRSTSLEFRRIWHFNIFGVHIITRWEFILNVGWTVEQDQTTPGVLNVTYAPFILGYTYLWNDINYYNFFELFIDPFVDLIHTQLPIEVTIHTGGKTCIRADYHLDPSYFYNYFTSRLQECKVEIIDELINWTPIIQGCHWIPDFNTTLPTINLYEGFSQPLLDFCISV